MLSILLPRASTAMLRLVPQLGVIQRLYPRGVQIICERQVHAEPSGTASQTQTPQPDKQPTEQQADVNETQKLLEKANAKYMRTLADMENLRKRHQKELEDTKKYATQKFCKDLIEITDVLQIALSQISPESVGKSNYEGIEMIDKRIKAIFNKHGLVSLNPKGEKFNPYEHQAMFETPDASQEPGTVGEVCKEGWKLHDRIVRPAVVGVVKKPD